LKRQLTVVIAQQFKDGADRHERTVFQAERYNRRAMLFALHFREPTERVKNTLPRKQRTEEKKRNFYTNMNFVTFYLFLSLFTSTAQTMPMKCRVDGMTVNDKLVTIWKEAVICYVTVDLLSKNLFLETGNQLTNEFHGT
jgi:hypothetical protein